MKTNTTIILILIAFRLNFLNAQATWHAVEGLPFQNYYKIEKSGDSLVVASINKLYISTDGGTTWDSTAVLSPTVDYITGMVLWGPKWYVGTQNEGIFVSTDGGASWQGSNSGLTGLGATHIAMMTRRGAMMYIATHGGGVYRKSPFFPGGWEAYNQGMFWGNVESITNIEGVLYAGAGSNATVSTRRDDQTSWEERPFDAFNGQINAFLGIIKEGNVLLAAGEQGLYRSDDGGEDWEGQSTGLGLIGAVRFTSNGQGRVWAHMAKPSLQSIFRYTDDAGLTWHDFEPDFNNSHGHDLLFFQNNLFYARNNGLWKLDLSTGTEDPTDEQKRLELFPNPTAGDFNLRFKNEQKGEVDVIVVDGQGRQQTSVFSGVLGEGDHVLHLSLQGFMPGLYHVRLQHADGIQTGKLVLGL